MSLTFQQTDTAAACGDNLFCAAATLNSDRTANANCPQSGTTGSVEQNVRQAAETLDQASVFFQLTDPPTDQTWDSGTYTVDLNVTTGDSAVVWTETYVCRIDGSGCTNVETIGSTTGQSTALSAGIHSMNVSGAEVTTPSTGDDIYIVLVFDFTQMHGNAQIGVTPDQTITTPIVTSASVSETAASSITLSGAATDGTTATETGATSATLSGAATDATTAAETGAATATLSGSATESVPAVGVSETAAASMTLSAAATDAGVATETGAPVATFSGAAATEAGAAAETGAGVVTFSGAAATETAGGAETATPTATLSGSATESVPTTGVAESATASITLSPAASTETAAGAEAGGSVATFGPSATEAAAATETATPTATLSGSATESVPTTGVAENASALLTATPAAVESAVGAESAAAPLTTTLSAVEGNVNVDETGTPLLTLSASTTESVPGAGTDVMYETRINSTSMIAQDIENFNQTVSAINDLHVTALTSETVMVIIDYNE